MHTNDCLRVWIVLFGLHATISHEVPNDVTHEGDKVALHTHEDDVRSEDVKFQVLGRAVVPGVRTHDWISSARVLLDGDKHVGFLRSINKLHETDENKITMIQHKVSQQCIFLDLYRGTTTVRHCSCMCSAGLMEDLLSVMCLLDHMCWTSHLQHTDFNLCELTSPAQEKLGAYSILVNMNLQHL